MMLSDPNPHDHPDLRRFEQQMDDEFDDILAAERHAARIAAQRRMTMRDRLVRAEDLQCTAVVKTTTGTVSGRLSAVGTDHIVVGGDLIVAIAHIVTVEVTP